MCSHFFPAFFRGTALPPSFRAGLYGVMGRNVYGAVEALSREISCHYGPCVIRAWDFSTLLRCGRNDEGGGPQYGHFRGDRMTPALTSSNVISSGAAWSYGTECARELLRH